MTDDEIVERTANAMFAAQDASKRFRRAQSVKQRMSEYKVSEMCAMAETALRTIRALSPALEKEGVVDRMWPKPTETMIITIARAMYLANNDGPWNVADYSQQEEFKRLARAAIAALPALVSVQEQKT